MDTISSLEQADTPPPTVVPTSAKQPSHRWLPLLGLLVLVCSVLGTYAGALRAPFVFDDTVAVVNNPTIRNLASWAVLNPPAEGGTTTGRPLVNLSLAVDHAIGGGAVWSFHLTNILLHCGSALLLWGLLWACLPRALCSERGGSMRLGPVSFLIALCWGLHPLMTETVVCVAQRTEGLFGLLALGCLYCFVRAAQLERKAVHPLESSGFSIAPSQGGGAAWLAGAVACSLLGMASKEVMAVVPVLVLLLDRSLFAGSFAESWRRRRAFYLALACTWALLAFLLLRSGGSRGISAGFGLGVSWWEYFLTQWGGLVHYLRLCFWPDPLVLDYGLGVTRSVSQVWWQGLLLVGLGGAALWALVRRPALGFLGAAFFILLGPSSSVVPLVSQTLAEHRMYLPLAVVLTIVSVFLIRVGRALLVPVLVLSCVACALGTVRRVHDYRGEISVWEANVRDCPSNARGFLNLGFSLEQAGDPARAEACYRKAAELEPGYVQPRYNLGLLALRRGDFAGASASFSEVLALSPDFAEGHLGQANALVSRGAVAEAVPHYQRALALAPAPDVHYNLGLALVRLRRVSEAAAEFREVLASEPGNAAAWYQQGQLQLGAGAKAEGERALLECLRLEPTHLGALRALGMHFAQTGRLDRAGDQFLTITRLKPDDAEAWGNLGNVALFQGRIDEAIRHYEHALRLDPTNRGLRENLQVAREAR